MSGDIKKKKGKESYMYEEWTENRKLFTPKHEVDFSHLPTNEEISAFEWKQT